jgi:hypothetical protein
MLEFASDRTAGSCGYISNPSPPLRPLDFPLSIRRDVQVGPWSGAIEQEGDYEDGSDNQPKQSAFHLNDPLPC